MPCFPPLLLTGCRYVSRLLKDGVLSRSTVYHPSLTAKDLKELPALLASEKAKQSEQDSATVRSVDEYVFS